MPVRTEMVGPYIIAGVIWLALAALGIAWGYQAFAHAPSAQGSEIHFGLKPQ